MQKDQLETDLKMRKRMDLFEKTKTHLNEAFRNPSLSFIFNKLLTIILRRFSFSKRLVGEGFICRYMKPLNNGCFVDVGANFGVWTFFVAEKGYEVYAFEPSPRPYRFLMDNAPPNVHVFNLALGSNEGEAELKLHERSEYDSLVSENVGFSGKTVKVKVKTLDSLKLENVGLIKIDTEGFELPVILGARETILKWKPRIIVEVHKPFREQTSEIKALLKKLGYKVKVKHKLGTYQPMLICDPN